MSIFLKLDGITGEAADPNHKGWLDLITVEWGIQRKITASSSTRHDRESSNAQYHQLELLRLMDSATPHLMLEACCGRGGTAELHFTKTGNGSGSDTWLVLSLDNALVSYYDVDVAAQDITRPMEKVRLSFSSMELRYTPYDQDGKPLAPISAGFNATTNQKQ